MLTDRAAIERAVAAQLPGGLEPGHTVGMVGVVDNHGMEWVASVALLEDAIKVQGYYQHDWSKHWGKDDVYGGTIMFSK